MTGTDVADSEALEFNFSGQRFGRKGRRVREGLLQAARDLMARSPLTVPTLTAVTAAAGVKITSVYRYYPDVNSLLAEAMLQPLEEIKPVTALLEEEWPKGKEFQRALKFSTALYEYWRARRGILFVRNSLAERGDARFVRLRLDWARPMFVALATKLGQAHGKTEIDPMNMATARIILPGLERTLTLLLQSQELENNILGQDVADIVIISTEVREAFAHLIALLMKHDHLQE
jgi:AcrR family transcriptional regulator